MPRSKRTAEQAQLDAPTEPQMAPETNQTLVDLRNMWEFASLMQYIFLFGDAVKIDEDLDIEDLEHECLLPYPSERLAQIGLALLKTVSSHRGLTTDIFSEYTRRQYLAKAPSRNPFGDEEEPIKFNDLDVFTRIRVLHQLSTWTFFNESRIRERMPDDEDHLNWRIDPIGWDKEDRSYYVLDDNRLYRRTDAPPPPPLPTPKPKAKAKSKSKKPPKPKSRGTRSSKRFKPDPESEEEDEEMLDAEAGAQDDTQLDDGNNAENTQGGDFGFTSTTWECIAITLEEYEEFLSSIFRSRDANEKQLRENIQTDVLPILEKRAESLRQKQLKKQRELENLQKMAGAKRSSRLAVKADKEKEEREAREAEEKRQRELRMAREEQDRQRRIEEGHESRRMTREQRLKERESKRIIHEEELARLEREGERESSQDENDTAKRQSERQLKTQKEQLQKNLQDLQEDEDDWYFDCAVCGLHGENLDDGTHSMACDRCNVWQHSKCHGVTPDQASSDDFAFVCHACQKKEEDEKKPKIPSLKLGKRSSGSPEAQRSDVRPTNSTSDGPRESGLPPHVQQQLDGIHAPVQLPPHQQAYHPGFANGAGIASQTHPQGMPQPPFQAHYPPPGHNAQHRPPQEHWHGSPLPPPRRSSSNHGGSPSPAKSNGAAAQHAPNYQHQYSHQNAHQNAVQNSGGHPGYQPNALSGHDLHTGRQSYPMSSPPPPSQYPNPYTQHPSLQRFSPPQPSRQPEQPPHRPGSSHLMNGFQSPAKKAAPSSPAQLPNQPTPQPRQSPLPHSPMASFPPPSTGYGQNAGHSPTKSSPPPQPPQLPRASSQAFAQSSLQATPSNGNRYPQFHTPTNGGTAPPAPASATANGVAADGMSGPWPESSKVIPQKHDQSPAQQPLPSSSAVTGTPGNGAGINPPNLAPSPVHVAQSERGTVPVKRELDVSPGHGHENLGPNGPS